jgi:hypothetical protein
MKRSAFGVWRLAFGDADDIDIDTSLKQVTCKGSFSLRPSGTPNAERRTLTRTQLAVDIKHLAKNAAPRITFGNLLARGLADLSQI